MRKARQAGDLSKKGKQNLKDRILSIIARTPDVEENLNGNAD